MVSLLDERAPRVLFAISLTLILLVGQMPAQEIDVTRFQRELQKLANDGLGVEAFQDYLDGEVTFTNSALDGNNIIRQLSSSLATRFQERIEAVTAIRDALVAGYDYFPTTTPYEDCCYARLKENDPRFQTEVDLDKLCVWGEGYRSGSDITHVDSSILAVMKDNLLRVPGLKYQYYGSEQGMVAVYPSNKICSNTYDPRFRPWYVETATPTPKDVVVVVDKSGSMSIAHQGRKRMDIASEAASTVVSTLNPNDRVGVVSFSTNAETPPGSVSTSTCFQYQLAQATPQNKDYLTSYINTLREDGATYYDRAFTAAFRFFDSSTKLPEYDKRKRDKVILFLTDGEPTQSSVNYLDVIRDENAKQNNSVIILTFGLGQGLSETAYTILNDIAEQISHNPKFGPVTVGSVDRIRDPQQLRYELSSYYAFFKSITDHQEVLFSIPYFDAFGLGMITSACLPVNSTTFRGVTCVDMTLSDLFKDVTYFQEGRLSYSFIMDSLARLVIHPLLPRPYTVDEDPIFLHVPDLEQSVEIRNELAAMQAGGSGTVVISSKRVTSRGDAEHEGVDVDTVPSTYTWQNIPGTNFTLCIVIGTGDRQASVTWSGALPPDFRYHRTDFLSSKTKCKHFRRAARIDDSVVKFAPGAFRDPGLYLDQEERSTDVDRYAVYMTQFDSDNPGFVSNVRNEVAVTAKFDDVLDKQEAWRYAVWRYVGMAGGVFRLYPGAKLIKPYDHALRPWYKRALGNRLSIAFSKPYVDAFGAGIVITLSNALYEGKSGGGHNYDDEIIGVIGMDFTMPLFYALLRQTVDACRNDDVTCFVLDTSGYIVIHPDFLGASETDKAVFANVHVTVKEPHVAAGLIEQNILQVYSCINLEEIREQRFWRLRVPGDGVFSTSNFDIHTVDGTNVFVVVLKQRMSYTCYCSAIGYQDALPTCDTDDTQCQCPCYSRLSIGYNYCNTSFKFTQQETGQLPPCTPEAPSLDLASVANSETSVVAGLSDCYPAADICPGEQGELNCTSIAVCGWCGNRCDTKDTCPTGETTDGGVNVMTIAITVPLAIVGVIIAIVGIYFCCKRKNASATESHAVAMPTPVSVPTSPAYGIAPAGANPNQGAASMPTAKVWPEDPNYQRLAPPEYIEIH